MLREEGASFVTADEGASFLKEESLDSYCE